MRTVSRDRAMALGFVVASFALAFAQRPGRATSDTKIDLHVDPSAFVGQVASVWTTSIDLGAVHGAQYSGYLWPMGPIFALLHSIGLGPWVAHRIWLGLIFAISAWGVLRLMDAFVGRPRGVAHLVAAAFYLLNPYTVIFTGRTSIALLGYAALPWLLLIVHRGVHQLRGWHGWWWAAAFALILTSIGGGINGAVVGWMLVGPLVLLIYEPLIGNVRWRDSAGFLLRVGLLGTLASLWWIVPLAVHARYGIDFLQFTEQPRSIWGTNSAPEALRLMGYWTSYIGVGFHGANRPLFSEAGTLLFNPLAVGASLVLPAMAIAGFVWTRRWRYGPFLLLVLLVGVMIELAAFPSGTPSREAMEWVYRNVPLVRFMRTTQKAAPLVAIGVAGLLGLAARLAWSWLLALPRGRLRRGALVAAPVALATLICLAALPLVRGTAIERQLTWDRIPSAWTDAGADLDRELPRNSRALVLPGQIFANYTWGGTTDAILPRVTDRPVAVRYETPYGDPRATDLLWTIDRLVNQQRLLPGQLEPLLRLIGAGAVVTGSDDDVSRSGAVNAAAAAAELERQGLTRPDRSYGPSRRVEPPRGELGPAPELPQVRRYDVQGGRGIVHVEPSAPATVVDGGAEGLAGLAAFGALPERAPILYAGDLTAGELRRQAARGAELVVSDSNRRRRFVPEFARHNLGTTLAETDAIDENHTLIDPFPERGSDSQTVAVFEGARYVRAPHTGGLLEFPEYGAIKAFDGDPATVWAADRYFHPRERWIEVGFERRRDVRSIELLVLRDARGQVTEVDVNGVRADVSPGWNRIQLDLEDVSALRVTLTGVDQPQDTDLRGNGGLREIRIPGLRVTESLRPPVLSAQALGGRDLGRVGLTYLFERATADDPFRRDRHTGSPLLELAANRADAEDELERVVFAPAARSYRASAWVHPAVDAPDSTLDRLAGLRAGTRLDSSGRFHNLPRHRASSAFDGHPDTAWLGIWARPAAPYPWISWTTERAARLSRLRIEPPPQAAKRPTRVRVSWSGGRTPALDVAADGSVVLPAPVRSREFRLTVLDVESPAGASRRERTTRAVGIGSLVVPGMAPLRVPRAGPLRGSCGSVRVRAGAGVVALRPSGTVEQLDAGEPLPARGCRGPAEIGAGVQHIRSLPGSFSVDLLRLRSPAPASTPAPVGGGRVIDPGTIGHSSVDGVRVALDGPSWLVLGQSYSEGWRAECDGRDLGEPLPVDGYANGWRAPADCREAAFSYAPQGAARVGYAVSAVVCAALLVFLLIGLRRRSPDAASAPPELPAAQPAARIPLPRAAAIAFVVTIPLALLFAKRTSVVIFPLVTLILWRGVGVQLLTLTAAGLIGVVVPLLYLIASPKDRGGYNFEYSLETIDAHWVTEGALVLLIVACWRVIASARAAQGPVSPAEARPLVASPPSAAPGAGGAGAPSAGG
jgi:arabinofuranan 3-O-arabinosyltransferase